jgi:gliding motility-associated protein GldL
MGKTRRYYNRLEMFLSSERGKRALMLSYSWGAAVVIIGALCKILHVPYANWILCIAMITEACVFIISGFERPFSEYRWEDVFPVLKSKNPLDRPDFSTGGGVHFEGTSAGTGLGGGTIVIGDLSHGGAQAGVPYSGGTPSAPPSPQARVDSGMSAMGLNISEKDTEVLAESIKKLNSAAEQIAKMADLSEVTKSYIDQISVASHNLEKFSEVTGSLGEVSDSLINSCKTISGKSDEGDQTSVSYVENMNKLNENLSGLNSFYESQLTGIRSQMDTIVHINAGLNRIRDLYDSSIVDSATFRNENERMAQLLAQLNQVYSRMLQAMTVNAGGYPPAGAPQGYQPPYPNRY